MCLLMGNYYKLWPELCKYTGFQVLTEKQKLTNNKHSTLHMVGDHCNCFIKIWNELNVSWSAQHCGWMHFKNQAIQWFPWPYFKLWFQTKHKCLMETVLSFRILLRTGKEILKAEIFYLFKVGNKQLILLMMETLEQWLGQWIWMK